MLKNLHNSTIITIKGLNLQYEIQKITNNYYGLRTRWDEKKKEIVIEDLHRGYGIVGKNLYVPTVREDIPIKIIRRYKLKR